MKITQAELLDALAAATPGKGPDDARTTSELLDEARASGANVGRDALLDALHAIRKEGRLVVHSVVRESLLGKPTRVPAYTILAKKARGKS